MIEKKEIEMINDLVGRARVVAFDDFEGLAKLQRDMDSAFESGLIETGTKYHLIGVFLERVSRGEADEVCKRLYGIEVSHGSDEPDVESHADEV